MAAPATKETTFQLDDRAVPLRIRRNKRARKIIARIDPKTDGIVLTLPYYVAEAEGVQFLHSQTNWLRRRLEKLPDRTPLVPGAVIPLLGIDHEIRHAEGARRGVWAEDGVIHVSGQVEHVPRRVMDWLKKEAKRRLAERSYDKAEQLGVKVGRIAVRDTTSRWGSCAHDGSLNFSWRLILTPEFVFDFLVAHEVAHIVERNHGPNFHKLVDQLTDRADQAEAWLNAYGQALHRVG